MTFYGSFAVKGKIDDNSVDGGHCAVKVELCLFLSCFFFLRWGTLQMFMSLWKSSTQEEMSGDMGESSGALLRPSVYSPKG